jgi:Zn-dependent membrane protease YugP
VGVEEDGCDRPGVQNGKDVAEGVVDSNSLSDVSVEQLSSDDIPHGDIQSQVVLRKKVFIRDGNHVSRAMNRVVLSYEF